MEKYLFTDGTNVVREVQSKEELQTLVQSAGDPGRVRIWLFNTSEWISYAEFNKRSHPTGIVPVKITTTREAQKQTAKVKQPAKPAQFKGLERAFILLVICGVVFLVYNFSRVKWHTASSLMITAPRPSNTPLMDIDSLIRTIENTRGQKLDKVTQTNLRIRNSWPDRIELKLRTDRDTSQAGIKFYNIELSIDNSTGYNIDEAVVEVRDWRYGSVNVTDTFHFTNIGYSAVARRILPNEYRSDSISVSFLTLRSKAFNFCYSWDKESNYGNLNDRWFCRD